MNNSMDEMVEKKEKLRTLRNFLIFIIFSMISLALLLGAGFTLLLHSFGLLRTVGASPFGMVFGILGISIAIATVLAYYINSRILKPITALSEASNTVATGNFDVKINATTDIEELNATFENFNNMVTELNSIETLRSDFIANVSHEFKTPLSAIEGYAMLLQDDSISAEERADYINRIIDSAKRLSSLTGDILLISKIENQTFSSKVVEFRLDEQIREAILTHEMKWSEKDIYLDIELDEIVYRGEESLLLHVWLNLISNAVKFTPHHGRITVRLTQDDKSVYVKIIDSGIGMDEDTANHIFDKFFQGDNSHKSEGNGLGLSMTKQIIDRCKGSIKVESAVGKGSAFTVRLPK